MRKTLLIVLLLLLVPTGAAQTLPGVEAGTTPDSFLYGLDVAWDNAAVSLGLKSAGDIVLERAAETRVMAKQGNYEAAERAAQEMSKVAEKATDDDAEDISKATTVLQAVHESAPEEAKEGLQTALENVAKHAPEDYDFSEAGNAADSTQQNSSNGTAAGGLGDLCSSLEECMTYCASNQQDCINYCRTDPGNAICQELQRRYGGPPSDGMQPEQSTWDLEEGVPRFITHAVTPNISKVTTVSKFRSAAGHDYSTDMERCRTMKHYINGPQDGDPLPVTAPADGTIQFIETEQTGGDALVFLKPDGYPAFMIRQHHVTLADGIEEGVRVDAGDTIGVRSFIGGKWDTASAGEIAITVNTPEGRTFVSYFDAMTDEVFTRYQEAHGVESRDAFIISQAERDADPLDCNEDSKEEEYTGRVNNPEWSDETFGEWAYSSDNWVFFKELEARR